MGFITDFIKEHWTKIVFGLLLTIITFGVWCVYKCVRSLMD